MQRLFTRHHFHPTRRKPTGQRYFFIESLFSGIFVDIQRHRSWRQQGLFLEHAKVFGHDYGMLHEQLEKHIDAESSALIGKASFSSRNDVVSAFMLLKEPYPESGRKEIKFLSPSDLVISAQPF